MRVRVRKPSSAPARLVRAAWAPSLARRWLRHRIVWLVAAAALAAFVSLSIAAKAKAADAERVGWGTTTSVIVVDRAVGTGEPIAGAISKHELPAAMVPAGALNDVPSDSLAKVHLFPGEVLLEQRVTSASVSGIPEGSVAITLPVQVQLPLLDAGDLVDVWAMDPVDSTTRRVAAAALVLDFTDDDVTIAVTRDQVRAATSAARRPVTITLIG